MQIIKLNWPGDSLASSRADLAAYSGSSNLDIDAGDDFAYKGSKRFNNFNISGSLLLCGSWTVKEEVTVGEDALFEMNGTFVVGRNNEQRAIVVESGATLRIAGNLTIYGDLIINNGATVYFIGNASVVNIFGSVTGNGDTTVDGTFNDVKNKF